MTKQGLNSKNIKGVLKETQSKTGWALCVGAGTSLPMFPNWNDLVKELITIKNGPDKANALSKSLLNQFSPDSLIQAAYNTLALSDDEFTKVLSKALFSTIKSKLNDEEWKIFTKAQLIDNPSSINFNDWKSYEKLCEIHFSKCSAYSIGEIIIEARSRDIGPESILSFNAETILFSFLNLFLWRKYAKDNGNKPAHKGQLTKHFDLVTHSISSRNNNRIPYICCHGILPISKNINHERKRLGGIAKLVFAESSYLQLANNAFSWQSSSFLDVCAKSKVVFIGVSLSDPNMRRWLSWLHDNKISELSSFASKPIKDSTSHFWINTHPKEASEARWIEATVSHLGVRLIWLNDWNELESTLNSMLSLK